jgi:hypothetical protein
MLGRRCDNINVVFSACYFENALTTYGPQNSIEHSMNTQLAAWKIVKEISMTAHPSHATSLPPDRRGRLRNGATPGDFLAAPRCGARTRAGECCRQPAMRNGRCRMHGGLSTGPRTAEGRARCASARRTHGFYSAEITALRRAGTAYCRRMDALFAALKAGRAAGHGLLPSNRAGTAAGRARARRAGPSPASSASPRLRGESSSGPRAFSAGHGVHPSFPACPLDSARPLPQPAPRQGFVQRTLLGGTALGLGRAIQPPLPAGHGLLPPFSRRAG